MATLNALQEVAALITKGLPAGCYVDSVDDPSATSFYVHVEDYSHVCKVSLETQGSYLYKPQAPHPTKNDRIAVAPDYGRGLYPKRFGLANTQQAADYALSAVAAYIASRDARKNRATKMNEQMAPFQKFLQSRVALRTQRDPSELHFDNQEGDEALEGIIGTNGDSMSIILRRMTPETARLVVTAIFAALEEPQDVPDLFD